MISYHVLPTISDESLNELFATAWDNYKPSSFRQVLQHSLTYVCAFDGDLLVGFVNVAWDGRGHAFILDTTVRKSYQRQGIGKLLLEKVVSVTKEKGIEWLHVDFEPHLLEFYRSCGFEHTEAGLLNLVNPTRGE